MLQTVLHYVDNVQLDGVHMPGANLLYTPFHEEPFGCPLRTDLVVLQVPRLQEGGKRLFIRVFHRIFIKNQQSVIFSSSLSQFPFWISVQGWSKGRTLY